MSKLEANEPVEEYRLIRVHDLREIEEATGQRVDIIDEEKVMCNHCTRLVNIVCTVVRLSDGKEFEVGSACGKNLFGWQPERDLVKKLLKEDKARAENRAIQRLDAMSAPIIAEIEALPIPPIVKTGVKNLKSGDVDIYAVEGTNIAGIWCREGLTEERRKCCITSWHKEELFSRLHTLYPLHDSDDIQYKKYTKLRYHIERMAFHLF